MCENNLLWPWNSNRSIPEYQERHMSINRSPSIGLKTLFNVHNMYRMSNVTAAIFQNWICCVHTTMQLYARAGLPVQAHPYDIRICWGNFLLSLFWCNSFVVPFSSHPLFLFGAALWLLRSSPSSPARRLPGVRSTQLTQMKNSTKKLKKNRKFNYSIAKKCWRFLAEILRLKDGAKECIV